MLWIFDADVLLQIFGICLNFCNFGEPVKVILAIRLNYLTITRSQLYCLNTMQKNPTKYPIVPNRNKKKPFPEWIHWRCINLLSATLKIITHLFTKTKSNKFSKSLEKLSSNALVVLIKPLPKMWKLLTKSFSVALTFWRLKHGDPWGFYRVVHIHGQYCWLGICNNQYNIVLSKQ